MSVDLIAKRYAAAFFKCLDGDAKRGQAYLEPLNAVASMFAMEDARRILSSPIVPNTVKRSFFDGIFKAQNADQLLKNFIYTILDKNRIEILPFVAREFQLLLDAGRGVTRAEIVSSVPLSQEAEDEVRSGLRQYFNTDIEVQKSVDPSLLGGLVIKVGNRILDLSLKTKMEGIFQHIVK